MSLTPVVVGGIREWLTISRGLPNGPTKVSPRSDGPSATSARGGHAARPPKVFGPRLASRAAFGSTNNFGSFHLLTVLRALSHHDPSGFGAQASLTHAFERCCFRLSSSLAGPGEVEGQITAAMSGDHQWVTHLCRWLLPAFHRQRQRQGRSRPLGSRRSSCRGCLAAGHS